MSNGLLFKVFSGYHNENVNYDTTATLLTTGYTTSISNNNVGTNGFLTDSTPRGNYRSYVYNGSSGDPSYSIFWYGYFLSDYTGTWTFRLNSDDGSFLWLGEPAVSPNYTSINMLIDNSGGHGMRSYSNTIQLVSGTYYPIRIMFGEGGGGDDCMFSWDRNGLNNNYNGYGYFFTTTNYSPKFLYKGIDVNQYISNGPNTISKYTGFPSYLTSSDTTTTLDSTSALGAFFDAGSVFSNKNIVAARHVFANTGGGTTSSGPITIPSWCNKVRIVSASAGGTKGVKGDKGLNGESGDFGPVGGSGKGCAGGNCAPGGYPLQPGRSYNPTFGGPPGNVGPGGDGGAGGEGGEGGEGGKGIIMYSNFIPVTSNTTINAYISDDTAQLSIYNSGQLLLNSTVNSGSVGSNGGKGYAGQKGGPGGKGIVGNNGNCGSCQGRGGAPGNKGFPNNVKGATGGNGSKGNKGTLSANGNSSNSTNDASISFVSNNSNAYSPATIVYFFAT